MNTENSLAQTDGVSNITITLKDSTNAFTKYNMSITVDPLINPKYSNGANFILNWSSFVSIPIKIQSQSDIYATDCQNENLISNALYNKKSSILEINFISNLSCKSMWIKFKSNNSWNQSVYSDNFIIYFDNNIIPAITNSFGPIYVMRGVPKLFPIPSDLFSDPQDFNPIYNATNWIDKDSSLTQIKVEMNNDQYYIFAQSNDTFIFCLFEIYVTNIFGRTNQYQTQLNIIRWSSKDWTEWIGPYQSNWTKWRDGYSLEKDGTCLSSVPLFSFSQLMFYKILGIMVWLLILIQLILVMKLRSLFLHSLFYVQPILVLIFSMQNVSDEMTAFASYFQWTKLDMNFMFFKEHKILRWEQSSEKMIRVQFYWQSTFHNYLFPFSLLIMSIFIIYVINNKYINWIILQKLRNIFKIYLINKSSLIIFIFLNISQFYVSNLIIDIVNFNKQIIFSLISIWVIVLAFLILMITKWKIFSAQFINEIDPAKSLNCFFINLIRNFVLSVMFALELTPIMYSLFLSIILTLQILLVLVEKQNKTNVPDEIIKEKLVLKLANVQLIVLMMVIWTLNAFPTVEIKKLWALIITEFFIFYLFVSLFVKFIKINK